MLAAVLAITALSLARTIPFQCLYGAGGLLILDVALAGILLRRGLKKQIQDRPELGKRRRGVSNWPEGFPVELWAKVFEHLDLLTLAKISGVCREWQAIAHDDYVVRSALAKEDWPSEKPNLQRSARIIYGLKRKISPALRPQNNDLKFLTSRSILTSSHNTLLLSTGNTLYFVVFDLDSEKYLGESLNYRNSNNVNYNYGAITCYGSTAYFCDPSNRHLYIWQLGFAQNIIKWELSRDKILALCATKLKLAVLVEDRGLKIFSRNDLSLQKSWNFKTCPKLSISKSRRIYAYKEKVYFRDAEDKKIMELDLETGELKQIYRLVPFLFNNLTKKIYKFRLSNGVLLIQPSLWEKWRILRYDIEAEEWLPELPGLSLKGAFCSQIFSSRGGVWDFAS